MSNDSTNRTGVPSQYTPSTTPPPAMYCAECRTIMRLTYYSLNARPLCPKCSAVYRARIERGTGPGSMGRAVLYGTGAALAGMIGVAILLSVVGAFRIIAAIGVAYLVAGAIGRATGNYGGRRYQLLAVSLTYVALGLAMLVPVYRAAERLDAVTAPPKLEDRYGPAGQQAALEEELQSMYAEAEEDEDPAVVAARVDSLAAADSVARLERTRANMKAIDSDASFADRLAGGAGQMLVGAIVLLVILPLLSGFGYGLYAGVISIFALGFALKKAWDLTDLVADLELTGPFKVGTGPIPPAIGG